MDIFSAKQNEIIDTPLFLFECRMNSGAVERWSTHRVTADGHVYHSRVLDHNLFELKSSVDDGADTAAKIALTLANADSYFSQVEWNDGWKGSRLTVRFAFADLKGGTLSTDTQVLFQGVANAADEITESAVRVTFTNRLNLQRIGLPEIRIQKRCPWLFPSSADQRVEAKDGGALGKYSPFYRCGYSADVAGGRGNRNASGDCFTSCDYTRAQCVERGMFDKDAAGAETRRFGGVEFVPSSVLVRGYGEKDTHLSTITENEARYNDFAPVVFGTAWYQPPVVFARNDGNLTRMEVLLCAGEITSVVKVIVNDIEIPQGVAGASMTSTGWYNVVSGGGREGGFNLDFKDAAGEPAGDPYGSMATLSVVVPNRVSTGTALPRIQVLLKGMKLARFDAQGQALAPDYSNNPAWVLLEVLRRSGWRDDELDLGSFAHAAQRCDEPVEAVDVHGNTVSVPRYECNLVLRRRRSAADVIRGIRNGSALLLAYSPEGKLSLRCEDSIANQQPTKPATSNSREELNGGWPAYEFSDGSARFSGILRKENGEPHLRFWSRPASETPNRLSVEFQDELNEYQQDSLSLVDIDDAVATGREVAASLAALGLPNFTQAARIARLHLNKYIAGNLYVDIGTTVRGFGLAPGDIIALTYEKEGLVRQPFRVIRVTPGRNYRTAVISAQLHEDAWYEGDGSSTRGSRRQPAYGIGLPRPLAGSSVDENGRERFDVTETVHETSDGSATVGLSVRFSPPNRPSAVSVGIPLLSLTPALSPTGGTIAAGQTLYYAISAVDEAGNEGRLSFTVKATVPDGDDTNTVKLRNLSFSEATTAFHVYRGATPVQLTRVAENVPVAEEFTDTGVKLETVIGPPDENYDHANFYWRFETQPESPVTAATANTLTNDALTMLANENRGLLLRITSGKGAGQERMISANTPTTLTVSPTWDVTPDATSAFVIAEPSWRFGALTTPGPAEFDVPNRSGATIHILGRSANVHDQECAADLSPLTRWEIGGAGGAGDSDVPPEPMFGFAPTGQGTVEFAGVGFHGLENTRTVTSGTLSVYYWNELSNGTLPRTTAALTPADAVIQFDSDPGLRPGDLIQLERELVVVTEAAADGLACTVERGAYMSHQADHDSGIAAYVLSRRTYVVPFARHFFGSPASGSYNYPILLPDVRIAAADFFVTNDLGNSPTSRYAFTANADAGIRTLSGGQFSIQVDGTVAIQNDAAPAVIVEQAHAVRDVYAVIREATNGGDIAVRVKHNGETYCDLVIPSGETVSNVVNGFGMPPLASQAQLSIDVVSCPQDPATYPGRDLTVTIRL